MHPVGESCNTQTIDSNRELSKPLTTSRNCDKPQLGSRVGMTCKMRSME